MFTIQDLVTILNGVIARGEEVDVCLSCDWCDMAHTINLKQVYIEDGKLYLENDGETKIAIKNIDKAEVFADPIGREYHISEPLGHDLMITLE